MRNHSERQPFLRTKLEVGSLITLLGYQNARIFQLSILCNGGSVAHMYLWPYAECQPFLMEAWGRSALCSIQSNNAKKMPVVFSDSRRMQLFTWKCKEFFGCNILFSWVMPPNVLFLVFYDTEYKPLKKSFFIFWFLSGNWNNLHSSSEKCHSRCWCR